MNNNQTQPARVALLVHTCDRYRFLYPGFGYFFNKNWDFDTRCSYYFATEEATPNVPGFTTLHSGKGQWADRLRYLLQNVITEPYVLYMQEDMWLHRPVSAVFFNQLFTLMQQNQLKQVKLNSAGIYKTRPTNIFVAGFNIAQLDNAASGYLMSHQITLWDKEFLTAQLYPGEHPWRNERRGTKRLKKLDPAIYHADYFAENGQQANNNNEAGAASSGYNTVSANSMLQANVLPYIEELKQAGPAEQAYAAQLLNHYNHQLTHDGLPKPRKEDIFKKIKNWFK